MVSLEDKSRASKAKFNDEIFLELTQVCQEIERKLRNKLSQAINNPQADTWVEAGSKSHRYFEITLIDAFKFNVGDGHFEEVSKQLNNMVESVKRDNLIVFNGEDLGIEVVVQVSRQSYFPNNFIDGRIRVIHNYSLFLKERQEEESLRRTKKLRYEAKQNEEKLEKEKMKAVGQKRAFRLVLLLAIVAFAVWMCTSFWHGLKKVGISHSFSSDTARL